MCDGTEDNVDDAMKTLKTLVVEAMKEAEDVIKKGMKNTEAAKGAKGKAKGAVKELKRASKTLPPDRKQMSSLKQKKIQELMANCVMVRYWDKMVKLDKNKLTKREEKEQKEFEEDMAQGDKECTEEILEVCDGTEDNVDDAMKTLKTLVVEAMKEAEDVIKKGMKNTEAAKGAKGKAKGAVKELKKASGTKRKGPAGSLAKNKRK